MKQLSRTICILFLGLLVSSALGCHYTAKQIFPKQYHSIAVPIFKNTTFYRGVEDDLAEALTKQLETRTPYAIASTHSAQTALSGTITSITQRRISRSGTGGLSQEIEIKITVNFIWKDLQTGKVILERKGFTAVGHYVPAHPVAEPFEVAQNQAVSRLANNIVNQMAGDW